MAPDAKLQLSSQIPWSEPAWHHSLASPYYKDSHRQLRDSIRDYVDKHVLPSSPTWEEAGSAPPEETLRFASSGIPFEDVPDRYRPADIPRLAGVAHDGLDAFHLLVGADELARIEGGVSIALGGASSIGVPPIVHHGTEAQKQRWLPKLFSCETSFCLGVTEPQGGSDVARLRTRAELSADGESYVVNGAKKWITGAPWATHMTTAVRTGGPGAEGISVLVIPLKPPPAGLMMERLENSGQKAGGASLIHLEDVRVPRENLIGRENGGFPILMTNFNKERFILAVGCNRKSRTCLAMAFWYALRRETFGKLLLERQVIRRKLAEVAHRVEAHWAWLEQVAFHVQQSPLGWQCPEVAGRIALLKVQGGQMLEMAAREAQQVFGGAGYQKAGPGATVEQISRDLRMFVVGGGSEEIMTDLAIRQELLMAKHATKL
ncbi:acyl-CoA dehydrogenase [Ophiocordyceps camponoti-floridani]|uniref:Acyl-CoA dehydrogenase n=1 Tax=Ophiocordyceps camponoti-floridani TaxID=2030778 RepID=A0A8H4Q9Y6_9HYPO|nr:acyl-CoA dehydrogenase [Ophiocordyceps camponoti-floridani]